MNDLATELGNAKAIEMDIADENSVDGLVLYLASNHASKDVYNFEKNVLYLFDFMRDKLIRLFFLYEMRRTRLLQAVMEV